MNFLAHLALAAPTPASRIGNLLGDFAKGTVQSLSANYPPEIINGIITHRAIDKFTDAHPAFLQAKKLLHPARRRFAGIIIDIIYDHFLTKHWTSYHPDHLPTFIQKCYRELQTHPQWLPSNLKSILPALISQDWLTCYGSHHGIDLTFRRVARRGKHTAPVANAIQDLEVNHRALENSFLKFYPQLMTYSKTIPTNRIHP